ncbi:MAG: sugar nucleotide-binding protein [Betaproteobacteria bacterium]|nr:sugar nucleotide-binding protein [Betaproteobacteria bacterium]
MRILIIGSNGFIARHVRAALVAEGHAVRGAARRPHDGDIACDLRRDTTPDAWRARIAPFDAVIHCAGVLSGPRDELDAVHRAAPAAIAAVCAQAHKPLLHLSALNLDLAPDTPYFSTKRAGEDEIRHAHPGTIIVRPSVVFGADGPAARMALWQARMPVLVLPVRTGLIVPIHVDDLAALCATLIGTVRAQGVDVDAVGSAAMTLEEYLQALRRGLGRAPARVVQVPNPWLRAGLALTGALRIPHLHPALLDLLEHRHTGHPQHFLRWMRRDPTPVSGFLAAHLPWNPPGRTEAKPRPV